MKITSKIRKLKLDNNQQLKFNTLVFLCNTRSKSSFLPPRGVQRAMGPFLVMTRRILKRFSKGCAENGLGKNGLCIFKELGFKRNFKKAQKGLCYILK